ncbi:hypothetical protein BH10CHL1_BH10CHL1_20980 [soil metagenome]
MQVTLYSKPSCHLCSDLKADLLPLQAEFGFALLERNIEEDAEDFARFRYLIPVLDIAGGELLYPPHTSYTVRRALEVAKKNANRLQTDA